jgi:dTDP-4-amino-4,6-dideoxygalactose transaminase
MSGRAAIALALRELGVESTHKVLVPTYHCPTMIAPVVQAGAHPFFYPLTASGAPDLAWLAKANLEGVHAMLAAHYFGWAQPMAGIRSFCDAHRIPLIEDCAHMFFGVSDDRPVGSWGDVAIASLTKFFPVTEGGLIVSQARSLDRLSLHSRSWSGEFKAAVDVIECGARHQRFPGLNTPLRVLLNMKDQLRRRGRRAIAASSQQVESAAFGALSRSEPAVSVAWIVKLVSRARIIAARRRNYARLADRLGDVQGARPLHAVLPQNTVPYVFPLYVDDPEASYRRLRAAKVPICRWDDVWPNTSRIENDQGLGWAHHVFQLGCHQDLSEDDISAIADTVRAALDKHAPSVSGISVRD